LEEFASGCIMNNFILQNLKKFDKLTTEQAKNIFAYTIEEVLRLESVIDSVNAGVLVCDESHKLILTNKAAARLLMMNDLRFGNEKVWNVIKDAGISDFLENTLVSGGKAEGREFEFYTNGAPRVLSFKVLPLVKEYRVTGSLIVAEDITERKKNEREAYRVESAEILATLAAGIAHEIKNPLAAISIQVQILEKALSNAKKKYDALNIEPLYSYGELTRHLAVVTEEIDRLNTIVTDFLFAMRPMFMTFHRGAVNDLIMDIAGLFHAELEESKIKFSRRLKPGLPLIDFDRRFLKNALLNLIKNSIEAMKGGGALTLETDCTDSEVLIKIRDTGCGISEADKEKIFAPYFTTKETGTGLGLVLVFRIIREHSGKITVLSKEGEGTEFIISLPVPRTNIPLLPSAPDKR